MALVMCCYVALLCWDCVCRTPTLLRRTVRSSVLLTTTTGPELHNCMRHFRSPRPRGNNGLSEFQAAVRTTGRIEYEERDAGRSGPFRVGTCAEPQCGRGRKTAFTSGVGTQVPFAAIQRNFCFRQRKRKTYARRGSASLTSRNSPPYTPPYAPPLG
jgi:hypothetical protein